MIGYKNMIFMIDNSENMKNSLNFMKYSLNFVFNTIGYFDNYGMVIIYKIYRNLNLIHFFLINHKFLDNLFNN